MIKLTTLKALSKAISKDNSRFALGDIRKDGVDLIATNGGILLVVKNALEADEAMSATDSIDGVTAQAYAEHCKKAKKTSTGVHWDTLVENEKRVLGDRDIGRFPDYKSIMLGSGFENTTTVKVSVKKLQALLDIMKAEGKGSFTLTISEFEHKPMRFEAGDLEGMISQATGGE